MSQGIEPESRPADELAVQRLMADYCRHVDDGRFEDAADLFVADGVFEYGADGHTGRAALIAFLEVSQVPERRGRHSCGFAAVDFDDATTATAVTDFVFLGRADGAWFIKFVGRYHDRLRQDADRWRFVERKVVLVDA
jgi:SnoaL-like domain